MRRFFEQRLYIMACALDCRLYAPHVRMVIMNSHGIRHDSVQIVVVFRQRFQVDLDLGRGFSGMFLRIRNCYCHDIAVVHDLVFRDNMVSLLGRQRSRCEGEEGQTVGTRNILCQHDLVNTRHLFCFGNVDVLDLRVAVLSRLYHDGVKCSGRHLQLDVITVIFHTADSCQ